MTIEQYLKKKADLLKIEPVPRTYCDRCLKATPTCYCAAIRPFHSYPTFAILMHQLEAKRGVATGRMTHLCLTNSYLFYGTDFTEHREVNSLLADSNKHCVVLSPGPNSISLSDLNPNQRRALFPAHKQLIIFVIDGTWSQARRMKALSKNLKTLPMISFTPSTPSQFLVRKQPEAHCYATIEAVHTCITLTAEQPDNAHRNLLTAFSYMVNQQLAYKSVNLMKKNQPRF